MSFFVAGVSWASFDGECRKKFKVHGKKKKKKAFDALSKHKGPAPKSARSQFSNVHILSFLYSNLSHNHGAQGDDPLQNTHFWGN